MNVLVVIPAYNEQDCIVQTVEELHAVAPEFDYVIVNDGSKDDTARLIAEHNYNAITMPINVGLTPGFKTGMNYALRHNYDAVLQFDADGQHHPAYIRPMVETMQQEGVDIVVGSRFVTEKKSASMRMIGSRLISGLIKLTTGAKLNDPTSGMRLYNRSMIEIFATRTDFGPEPDSLAYLLRKGISISEVQVSMRDRLAGESYLNPISSIKYMMRTCSSILFLQWFR